MGMENSALAEATIELAAARVRWEEAPTKRTKRLAAEDIEFWGNRTAFLSVAVQNREANWPAAALADPPMFPFEFDRHTYTAESDAAWRDRNGLA